MSKKEDKVIDKLSTGNTISYSVDILLIFARLQPRGQKLKTWNQISKKLEKKLSQDEFNTWIRPLQGEFKENSLEISAPNDFVLNYVSNNLKSHIYEVVASKDTKIIFKDKNNSTFVDKYVEKPSSRRTFLRYATALQDSEKELRPLDECLCQTVFQQASNRLLKVG